MTIRGACRLVDSGWAYRRWYAHARLVVGKLAAATDTETGRVADVLAVTSPRRSVASNLRVAYRYLRGDGLPRDVVRSVRVSLDHYDRTGEIRGPKTSAFALALRGDNSVVVVDTHVATAFGYRPQDARTVWVRTIIGGVLRRVATRRGVSVVEAQAALWAGYYRTAYPTGRIPMYRWASIVPF